MRRSTGDAQVASTMLAVDPFALFFKALAIIGVAIVILTAIPYHARPHALSAASSTRFLLIAGLAICLAVSADQPDDDLSGMEFLSITSYMLAGYLREDRKSGEAAIKYFLYGATASAVMLYGMSLLYGATGTTDLAGIAQALSGKAARRAALAGASRRSSCCWPASASRPAWCRSTSGRPTPTKARRPRSPRSCPRRPRPPASPS